MFLGQLAVRLLSGELFIEDTGTVILSFYEAHSPYWISPIIARLFLNVLIKIRWWALCCFFSFLMFSRGKYCRGVSALCDITKGYIAHSFVISWEFIVCLLCKNWVDINWTMVTCCGWSLPSHLLFASFECPSRSHPFVHTHTHTHIGKPKNSKSCHICLLCIMRSDHSMCRMQVCI